MSEDQVRRSYVAIHALRDNAPNHPDAEYVAQYHHELDRLEGLGFDVHDWRVPEAWIQRRLIAAGGPIGELWTEPQIDKHQLLAKLDAVLGYFAVGDRPIGFEGPRRTS